MRLTSNFPALKLWRVVGLAEADKIRAQIKQVFRTCKTNYMRLKFSAYSSYGSENDGVNNVSSELNCKHTHISYKTTSGRHYETPLSCRQFLAVLGMSDMTPANWHERHCHVCDPVCQFVLNVDHETITTNHNSIWHIQVPSEIN